MFDARKFGSNLSRLRKGLDMTQSALADRLNLTRQAISKYETGDSFPDISLLADIAELFRVRVEDLIAAGGPTRAEAGILLDRQTTEASKEEVVNIAPYVKPSVLDKLADSLARQGIDISELVTLSEYMNANSIERMLGETVIDPVNDELMEKLIPVLNDESKLAIFEKILNGEMDWHFIRILIPYAEYLTSQIEAAVLEGAIPYEALKELREGAAIAWRKKHIS
jgi:transcriptional regulator with XRE-family HTH domain